MNRTIVLHIIALLISAVIIWWLYRWTMFALYDTNEFFAKPWRPWARLAFSAVITVLLLGTQVFVARRSRLL